MTTVGNDVPLSELALANGIKPVSLPVSNGERLSARLAELEIDQEAKRLLRQKSQTGKMTWDWQAGQDLDRTPIQWRIDDLLAIGDTVLLSAQYKAGKTVLTLELARALAQGTRNRNPFMGLWDVMPLDGRLAVINMEMRPNQLAGYMPDSLLHNPRVDWHNYRGRAQNMNLLDDAHFGMVCESLKDREIEVLIIDPLQPVFMATGTDSQSNDSVSRLMGRLAALKEQTRISELVITHHTGHADKTRARGASDLMGGVDELWNLKLSSPDDPTSPRVFSGRGRDGLPFSVTLTYDRESRELRASDSGAGITRPASKKELVRSFLTSATFSLKSRQELFAECAHIASENTTDEVVKELVDEGALVKEKMGTGNKFFYSTTTQSGQYSE